MYNIRTRCIVFELCLLEKKKEKEERKKKEDEQNRLFRVWFSRPCQRLAELIEYI